MFEFVRIKLISFTIEPNTLHVHRIVRKFRINFIFVPFILVVINLFCTMWRI